jgi:hypothetical protein
MSAAATGAQERREGKPRHHYQPDDDQNQTMLAEIYIQNATSLEKKYGIKLCARDFHHTRTKTEYERERRGEQRG